MEQYAAHHQDATKIFSLTFAGLSYRPSSIRTSLSFKKKIYFMETQGQV